MTGWMKNRGRPLKISDAALKMTPSVWKGLTGPRLGRIETRHAPFSAPMRSMEHSTWTVRPPQ